MDHGILDMFFGRLAGAGQAFKLDFRQQQVVLSV